MLTVLGGAGQGFSHSQLPVSQGVADRPGRRLFPGTRLHSEEQPVELGHERRGTVITDLAEIAKAAECFIASKNAAVWDLHVSDRVVPPMMRRAAIAAVGDAKPIFVASADMRAWLEPDEITAYRCWRLADARHCRALGALSHRGPPGRTLQTPARHRGRPARRPLSDRYG